MIAAVRRALVVAAVSGTLAAAPAWTANSAPVPAMLEVRATTGSMSQLGAPTLENKIATIADYASAGLDLSLADADLGGALEIHNVSSFDVVVVIHCSTQADRQVSLASGTQATFPMPNCVAPL